MVVCPVDTSLSLHNAGAEGHRRLAFPVRDSLYSLSEASLESRWTGYHEPPKHQPRLERYSATHVQQPELDTTQTFHHHAPNTCSRLRGTLSIEHGRTADTKVDRR